MLIRFVQTGQPGVLSSSSTAHSSLNNANDANVNANANA